MSGKSHRGFMIYLKVNSLWAEPARTWKQELWYTKHFHGLGGFLLTPPTPGSVKPLRGVNTKPPSNNCTALIAGDTKITQAAEWRQQIFKLCSGAGPRHHKPLQHPQNITLPDEFSGEKMVSALKPNRKAAKADFFPPSYCSLDSSHSRRNTQSTGTVWVLPWEKVPGPGEKLRNSGKLS